MLNKLKGNIDEIIKVILVIALLFLSIQKGGFYKNDNMIFSIIVEFLGLFTIIYYSAKNKFKGKVDIIGMILLALPICYSLPIVFKNYASLNDSITEIVRYFNIYLIYKIVSLSKNKKSYEYVLIAISLFLGTLGIDGMGNRLFLGILKKFNSGYLDFDITRMSSTIQYANVLAIIFLIASVFIFKNLFKSIKENNKKKFVFYYSSLFFTLLCLILTQSRVGLLLATIYYITHIICLRENKEKAKLIILTILFELIVFTVISFKGIYINKAYIYYIFGTSILFSVVIAHLIYIYFNKESKVIDVINKNKKKIYIGIVLLLVMYILLGIFLTTPLKITGNSADKVARSVYVHAKDENKITFNVENLVSDSRYQINIYSVSENNEKELLNTFDYYRSVSGNFEYSFKKNNDFNRIDIEIKCEKGGILVDNFTFNGDKKVLNYAIIPTDIVNKLKEVFTQSDSIKTRIIYLKDALKIWNLSFKNRIVGVGGEGFKNLYQTVQRSYYTSTEVHNSFVQILVESGILGFISILAVVIIYLLKADKNIYKSAFILLLIHMIVDLDFSYTIIFAIFAILLAINDVKYKKELESNTLKILEFIVGIILSIFVIYVEQKVIIAYSIKVPIYESDVTLSKEATKVSKLEKRVMLDSADNKYRKELAKEYESYLKLLTDKINEGIDNNDLILESKNIVKNMEINLIEMQENENFDKNNLVYLSNSYFNNLNYFVKNSELDEEDSYNYYLNKIAENISFVEENYKYNEEAKRLVRKSYNSYYNELKNSGIKNSSVEKYINYFGTKVE